MGIHRNYHQDEHKTTGAQPLSLDILVLENQADFPSAEAGIGKEFKMAAYATTDNTVLFLPSEGKNLSRKIADVSINEHALNVVGDCWLSTTAFKWGSSSIWFGGVGDYIEAQNSAVFNLGSGDFTFFGWVRFDTRFTDTGDYTSLLSRWSAALGRGFFMALHKDGADYRLNFSYSTNGTNTIITDGDIVALSLDTQYLISFTRSGNTLYMGLDGAEVGTVDLTGVNIFDPGSPIWLGTHDPASGEFDFKGYMDCPQLIVGEALYTPPFTPPTKSPRVQGFYSIDEDGTIILLTGAQTGASGGGSGDKVRVSTTDQVPGFLGDKVTVGATLSKSITGTGADEKVNIDVGSTILTGDAVLAQYRLLCGVDSTRKVQEAFGIETDASGNLIIPGYAKSDVGIIVKEIATSPAAVASHGQIYAKAASGIDIYTKVTLHFEGVDNSDSFRDSSFYEHPFTAIGGAIIDTAQKKFGFSSGYFNGTTAFLISPTSPNFYLPGDFTIDAWGRLESVLGGAARRILSAGDVEHNNGDWCLGLDNTSGNRINFAYRSGGTIYDLHSTAVGGGFLANQQYHIQVSVSGGTAYYFLDGVALGSSAGIPSLSSGQSLYVGCRSNNPNSYSEFWVGWLDEIRFSVGVARNTSGFTPAAVPYTRQGLYYMDSNGIEYEIELS